MLNILTNTEGKSRIEAALLPVFLEAQINHITTCEQRNRYLAIAIDSDAGNSSLDMSIALHGPRLERAGKRIGRVLVCGNGIGMTAHEYAALAAHHSPEVVVIGNEALNPSLVERVREYGMSAEYKRNPLKFEAPQIPLLVEATTYDASFMRIGTNKGSIQQKNTKRKKKAQNGRHKKRRK